MWRKQIRAHRVAVHVSLPFSVSYSSWRPSMEAVSIFGTVALPDLNNHGL